MKVVLLAQLPPPSGGIASWTKRMQVAELKNGWKVAIVDEKVIGGRDIFGENTKKRITVEAKRCWGIWKNLWKELNDKNAVVVHSSIPAGFTGMLRETICALITKIRGRKFIIHFRCTVPNMVKDRKTLFMFNTLVSLSDAVIALNTPSVAFVEKYKPSKIVKLIPNFVSVDERKKNRTYEAEQVTVLYVGGVIREKGCVDLLECARRTPRINYRLVGAIDQEMKGQQIPENVTLCGETNKEGVQKEFNKADIFLFASFFHGEGFSNALAEAMANGLPCVVSDWAANADMIENKGGFVVPVHDTPKMVEAIEKLSFDSSMRREMGEWNRMKVERYYTQECVTSQYVDLYEELL